MSSMPHDKTFYTNYVTNMCEHQPTLKPLGKTFFLSKIHVFTWHAAHYLLILSHMG